MTGSSVIDRALRGSSTPPSPDGGRLRGRGIRPHPSGFTVELRSDGLWSEDGERVDRLEPGGIYRLQATIRRATNPSEPDWFRWTLASDQAVVFLQGGSEAGLLFEPTGPDWAPLVDNISYFEIHSGDLAAECVLRFRLTVPPVCGGYDGVRVELRVSESIAIPSVIAFEHRVRIRGETHGSPASQVDSVSVDLDRDGILGAVWLYISAQSNGLQLTRIVSPTHRSTHNDELAVGRQPPLNVPLPYTNLSTILSYEHARQVFSAMRNFSGNHLGDLIDWLRRLARSSSTESGPLRLIIVDETDTEVPWEMVEMENNRFLGGQITVARWIRMKSYGPAYLPLERRGMSAAGKVLYCIDAEVGRSNGCEGQQLATFTGEAIDRIDRLMEALCDLCGVALVYLAGHGAFAGAGAPEKALSSVRVWAKQRKRSITEVDLGVLPLLKIDDERLDELPVVFVNACHSGRHAFQPHRDCGLPALFLHRVACSYIGTLGEVDDEQAALIGAKVLAAAAEKPGGVLVADLLRDIRRSALDDFDPPTADDKAWRRFITSFLYAYYGDPRIRLELQVNSL